MKPYKIFFKDTEVASFNSLDECKLYIFDMLNVDRQLKLNQFKIFKILELEVISL